MWLSRCLIFYWRVFPKTKKTFWKRSILFIIFSIFELVVDKDMASVILIWNFVATRNCANLFIITILSLPRAVWYESAYWCRERHVYCWLGLKCCFSLLRKFVQHRLFEFCQELYRECDFGCGRDVIWHWMGVKGNILRKWINLWSFNVLRFAEIHAVGECPCMWSERCQAWVWLENRFFEMRNLVKRRRFEFCQEPCVKGAI